MRSYGQFCPIARASEILAERWTPIVLRNLLYGCTTFTELASGAPGMSRTLLSTRLRELQRAGVIEIRAKPEGTGSLYELTPAGRELWAVLQAIGDWGMRWLELAPETTSPDVVLWSWCTAYLQRDRLPDGRVLVRFEFPSQPAPRHRLWMLVDNGDAEICHTHPGFDEDLVVVVDDAHLFASWHLGLVEWGDALRADAIRVSGGRELARALPTWNRRRQSRSAFAARTPDHPGDGGAVAPGVVRSADHAGRLLQPGDEGYDVARRVWNGAIDRRPAVIARCGSVAEVIAALRHARERGLPIAVRGGGHGVAGTAVCDDGMVIDLSPMKDVDVQPSRRSVRAGAGVVWGELDAATQAFGLATTGGVVSSTGIAGLTLGGGIGWLMRRAGLTVDNLLAADLVTADGGTLSTSADRHPDLFWGLRGGGGSFGIVTSFTYRLHPVGPSVLAGPVLWDLEDAPRVLRAYRDLMARAPREVAAIVTLRRAPPLPGLPIELHGRPLCSITMAYLGAGQGCEAAAERALAPLRGLGRPLLDLVEPRPYTALQSLVDATVPAGWHYYWKTASFRSLGDDVVDAMVEHTSRITSPWSYSVLFHLGGAVADVASDATAYAHREALHALNINAVWLPDDADPGLHIRWTRDFFAAVEPRSSGAYLNFLDRDDQSRVAAAYGDTAHRRLITLKDRYDPDDVFSHSHSIRPSATPSVARAERRAAPA